MDNSRLIFLAIIALVLITLGWTAREARPYGTPASSFRSLSVRFRPIPQHVGVMEPIVLITSLPQTPSVIRSHITMSPRVPYRIDKQNSHRFLLLPQTLWPDKRRLQIRWQGMGPAQTLAVTTDADRQIRINLTHQLLYAVQDGLVIKTIPVSTGVSPNWVTPDGTFWIYRRVFDEHMVGGKPGTPDHWDVNHVPFAQYFAGAVAIHGAWWNHHFGVPRSHGCVQVPTDRSPRGATNQPADAEWLWHFADIGTPVIVYGTTPRQKPAKVPLAYPPNAPWPTFAKSSAS